tara:strand:+ start:522 stop:710 length:189 start_codon:yes stop_codon:yes gene_type:complete
MTKAQVLAELKETGELSTKMLAPLRIPFEGFLRFAQLSDEARERGVDRVINALETEIGKGLV